MNQPINDKQALSRIEALLRSIQPLPGEGFNRRMQSAPWNVSDAVGKRAFHLVRSYRLAGLIVIAVLLVGLAFTPAGQVLAQEIIQFFNQIIGNTFPLPKDQIMAPVPTSTPQPTYYPALLPADQITETESAPEVTPLPDSQLNLDLLQDTDSTTARGLVDFPLLEPSFLPDAYRLRNIRYDDTQKAVLFTYASENAGPREYFVLAQGRNLATLQIPSDATLETLRVGGNAIQWISAPTLFADGAGTVLRWEQAGVERMLEIFQGDAGNETGLAREVWLSVLNGLTICPADGSDQDYACAVNHAAVAAGFTPWQFPQAPDGYTFESVYYKAGQTAIWYASTAGELGVLQSSDNFKTQESNPWFSVPQDAIQEVTVNGQAAEYVNGSFVARPGEDHAIWNPDSGQIRLRWQQDGWWFQFVKWGAPAMQPQQLADLASNLTPDVQKVDSGSQAASVSSSQPEVYRSIAAAEKAYGKKFLQPAVLPDGLPFSHARIYDKNGITLFYGDFADDKLQLLGNMLMLSQGMKEKTFAEVYKVFPVEAFTEVEVNGLPAHLIRGGMLTGSYDASGNSLIDAPVWQQEPFCLTLYWEKEDQCYTLQFSTITVSGARISDADLIKIAESLQ